MCCTRRKANGCSSAARARRRAECAVHLCTTFHPPRLAAASCAPRVRLVATLRRYVSPIHYNTLRPKADGDVVSSLGKGMLHSSLARHASGTAAADVSLSI